MLGEVRLVVGARERNKKLILCLFLRSHSLVAKYILDVDKSQVQFLVGSFDNKMIGVSITCFKNWTERYPGDDFIGKQLIFAGLLKGKCEALELIGDYDMVKEILDTKLCEYKAIVRDFKVVTFHIHWISKLDKIDLKEFNKNMRIFIDELGIKHVVLHPKDYKKIGKGNFEFKIAVENMSPRRENDFLNLEELNELEENVVIDVNHIEEVGEGFLDKQIDKVKVRIVEVHFSVPMNKSLENRPGGHYPSYESGYNLPKNIPKGVIWISEAIFPKGRMDLVEKEIEVMRDYVEG